MFGSSHHLQHRCICTEEGCLGRLLLLVVSLDMWERGGELDVERGILELHDKLGEHGMQELDDMQELDGMQVKHGMLWVHGMLGVHGGMMVDDCMMELLQRMK